MFTQIVRHYLICVLRCSSSVCYLFKLFKMFRHTRRAAGALNIDAAQAKCQIKSARVNGWNFIEDQLIWDLSET